jgi:hypothetical protein
MEGSCLNCWASGFHIPLNSCTTSGLTFCTSLKELRETTESLNQDTGLPEPRYHNSIQFSLGIRYLYQLTINPTQVILFLLKRMLIISLSSLCDNSVTESLQILEHTTYCNGFLSIQLGYLSHKLIYKCITNKACSK